MYELSEVSSSLEELVALINSGASRTQSWPLQAFIAVKFSGADAGYVHVGHATVVDSIHPDTGCPCSWSVTVGKESR